MSAAGNRPFGQVSFGGLSKTTRTSARQPTERQADLQVKLAALND
jgi:hypothetical protein